MVFLYVGKHRLGLGAFADIESIARRGHQVVFERCLLVENVVDLNALLVRPCGGTVVQRLLLLRSL